MQHENVARRRLVEAVSTALAESPVTVLLGARQVGKTTLARQVATGRDDVAWFDLETTSGWQALEAFPERTLAEKRGLVVIDEAQRMPDLFRILRPLCDRPGLPSRFLLLGSAAPDLVRNVSESLAGRVQFVPIPGLALDETGNDHLDRLWLRGGFPRAFLAPGDAAARRWQDGFVQTFLERDIPQFGIRVPTAALRRFWSMATHYHGQILNLAELGRAMEVSPGTARHYLDILCGAFVLRQLPPWFENLGKRQVKSPKLYLRDSGLLHYFMGVSTADALRATPKVGASWEGFALEQVLARLGDRQAWFWSTQRGAELDLLVTAGGQRFGFEFKASEAPRLTPSMRIARDDLRLDHLWVLHPGADTYALHERITAQSFAGWSPTFGA
jgi:hypothetical protein